MKLCNSATCSKVARCTLITLKWTISGYLDIVPIENVLRSTSLSRYICFQLFLPNMSLCICELFLSPIPCCMCIKVMLYPIQRRYPSLGSGPKRKGMEKLITQLQNIGAYSIFTMISNDRTMSGVVAEDVEFLMVATAYYRYRFALFFISYWRAEP